MKSNEELIEGYQKQGLHAELVEDAPGKIYNSHRHNKTFLYTISGTVQILVDNTKMIAPKTGEEVVIQTDQLHEAVVGPEGWQYVAAWDAEEEKNYEVDH